MRSTASADALLALPLALVLLTACGDASDAPRAPEARESAEPAQAPEPAPPAPDEQPAAAAKSAWIDTRGTSVLGFGILRLAPPADGAGRYRLHYSDSPDGYMVTDNTQFLVLPGDAFAEREMAYAGEFLAFTRTPPPAEPYSGTSESGYGSDVELELAVDVSVTEETTVLVAYGPWEGADVGRPAGDVHTFTLSVEPLDPGAAFEWVESEAGELITTNWTLRPGVERGTPTTDPITGDAVWIEARPLILYDSSLARAADEPLDRGLDGAPDPAELLAEAERLERAGRDGLAADARERAEDLLAVAARCDRRIVLTPSLARRFRRVPIRWR